MNIHFLKLSKPNDTVVNTFNRWENDPELIPFTRPVQKETDFERINITKESLAERLNTHPTYLIYLDDRLVGEMNYMVDPGHLYQKVPGTAWIGITIGESEGRGRGIGFKAIQYLEKEIKKDGLRRIELGVFEFNQQAQKLYQKLGYKEIGRVQAFTYWSERMWEDIRMEKVF